MAASDATLKAQRERQRQFRERRKNAPSLDRIRPALGYVPGNVRVISYKANRLRNNGTFIEIMQVAIDAARLHNVYGDF